MHMQDGIGRSGYRLLAGVFLAIGMLGIVTTLYAFQQGNAPRGLFDWLGFALTFVALVALFTLSVVILWKRSPVAPEPLADPAPMGGPPIDFEFKKAEQPEMGPETVIPLPPAAARDPLVVQPNRNLGRDTKGWPRRQPPSGLTIGEKKQLRAEAVQLLTSAGGDADEIEFEAAPPRPRNGHSGSSGPSIATKTAKGRDMSIRVTPMAIARVAGPNDDESWNPEGTTTGKCGGCGARLYAPPERPIHLRCPKCEKVTLLE